MAIAPVLARGVVAGALLGVAGALVSEIVGAGTINGALLAWFGGGETGWIWLGWLGDRRNEAVVTIAATAATAAMLASAVLRNL